MARKPPSGGVGSNQYASKGRARSVLDTDEVRSRVDVERIATAFAPPDELDGAERVRVVTKAKQSGADRTQLHYAAHHDPTVRAGLASGNRTAVNILEALSEDPEPEVRRATAKNHATPPSCLAALAADSDDRVRYAAFENPNCPHDVLTDVLTDVVELCFSERDDTAVKIIARNVAASPELLTRIAEHRDRDPLGRPVARPYLAKNPNCPSPVLDEIVTSCHRNESYTAADALANPNCSDETLRHWATAVDPWQALFREHVASNPNCPPDLVVMLGSDTDAKVRAAVAGRGDVPVDVVSRLAADSATNVRVVALRNPICPMEVVEQRSLEEKSKSGQSAITARRKAIGKP